MHSLKNFPSLCGEAGLSNVGRDVHWISAVSLDTSRQPVSQTVNTSTPQDAASFKRCDDAAVYPLNVKLESETAERTL